MSSRHDGVSCDACNRNNFRLRRYKCLVCYDYDLCGNCYDNGRATSSHSKNHPMQCILTQADYDLFYSGDSDRHIGSYTCPLCGQLGFNKAKLLLHVFQEHKDTEREVICPLCSSQPDGLPNRQTIRFARHLEADHTESASSDTSSRPKEDLRYGAGNISSTATATQLRQGRHRPGIGRPSISPSVPPSAPSATTSRLSRADSSQSTTIDLTSKNQEREQQRAFFRTLSTGQRESDSLADTDRIAELISQINSIRSRATIRNQLASLEQQLENARTKLEERMQASLTQSSNTNAAQLRSIRSNQERPANPLLYHLLPVDTNVTPNSRSLRICNILDDSDEDEDEDDAEDDEDEDQVMGEASIEDPDDEARLLMADLMRLPVNARAAAAAPTQAGQPPKKSGCDDGKSHVKSTRTDCYVIGWDEGMLRQKDTGENESLMGNLIADRHIASNQSEFSDASYSHNQFLFLQEILTSSFSTAVSTDASCSPILPPSPSLTIDEHRYHKPNTGGHSSTTSVHGVSVTSNGDTAPHSTCRDNQVTNHYSDPMGPDSVLRTEPAAPGTPLANSEPKSSLLPRVSNDVVFKDSNKSKSALNNNDRV